MVTKPLVKFAILSDLHIGYPRWGDYSSLAALLEHVNTTSELDFVFFSGDNLDSGYSWTLQLKEEQLSIFTELTKVLTLPYYVYRGNHDANTPEFIENGVIDCNGVRLVCFFASYHGLPAAPGKYCSTGIVSPETLSWIDDKLSEGEFKHRFLACHYSLANNDPNFCWPILDYGGYNQIVDMAEKHSVKLYINGHEHNCNYPVGRAGCLYDINCGTATDSYSVCSVYDDKAVFDIFNIKTFELRKTIEIPLV